MASQPEDCRRVSGPLRHPEEAIRARIAHGGQGSVSRVVKAAVVAVMVLCGLSAPTQAASCSVLAHEANVEVVRVGGWLRRCQWST